MEQEIQKLQERLAKAKDVFREMTAKDKEKDARIADLEAQLAEAVANAVANANNNAKENEGTIDELKAQLRTMEDRWRDADGYCTKLTEVNEKLSNVNEMLHNQVEGAKNDINDLVVENDNLKSQIKEFETTNEDLRFENMKNKGERDRIEIDYNTLSESFKTVTDENNRLKEEMIEHNERFTMYEETNAEYKQSIDKLVESKQSLENTIRELKAGESALRNQISTMHKTIDAADAQVKQQNEELRRFESEIKMLRDELNKAHHDNTQIKENVTKHVAVIKSSMKGLNDGLGSDFNIFD